MSPIVARRSIPAAILFAGLIVILIAATVAQASERPVKEIQETHIGWNVNKTKEKEKASQVERNVCTVKSESECQTAIVSSEAGGFHSPSGVGAGPATLPHVYVADELNNRIDVLTPQGAFVSMFGWDVDKTTKENICTAASKDQCQPGQGGGLAAQMSTPMSVALNRGGDIYVWDSANSRVDEYSPAGEFILMIGGDVNETEDDTSGATEAQRNLCTAEEIKIRDVVCRAGTTCPTEACHGSFKVDDERGDLLAVDSDGVLYVGDAGRIQEFEETGAYKAEIRLAGVAESIAVEANGDLYALEQRTIVRKFTVSGAEISGSGWPFRIEPREKATVQNIQLIGLAVDSDGRVAVTGSEEYIGPPPTYGTRDRTFGLLLDGATATQITEFNTGIYATDIAFGNVEVGASGGFELYLAVPSGQEILIYRPVAVAELDTLSTECSNGMVHESDVTDDCELKGDVNPWEVPDTEVWFEWGRSNALGGMTPIIPICTSVCGDVPISVGSLVLGLPPNEDFYDRLAGRDANVSPPEVLNSATELFETPIVSPRVVAEPETILVHSTSAVMFDELNPENAKTVYFFEYGPCTSEAGCTSSPYPYRTVALESKAYGRVGITAEASSLASGAIYHYRLFAESESATGDEKRTASEGQSPEEQAKFEGVFETALAPTIQVITGQSSSVSTTSAIVSGAINADGQTAAYTFELGVDNGPDTQYGVVASGLVPISDTWVSESQALTGLQPGTTYAYRITGKDGYGTSVGPVGTFSTAGLPSVLASPEALPLLPPPKIAFPKPIVAKTIVKSTKCKHGYKRNKRGACVKVKSTKSVKKPLRRPH